MSKVENFITMPEDTSEWGKHLQELVNGKLTYSDDMPLILLAHADDGILWGQMVGSTLTWSSDQFNQLSPEWQQRVPQIGLSPQRKTLQQLRLFNESGELLIWRIGSQFQHRFCLDSKQEEDSFSQKYCLWGDRTVATIGIFSLLQEGERGLWHAPPSNSLGKETAQLHLCHYIAYDDMGQAYISKTRIVELEWK